MDSEKVSSIESSARRGKDGRAVRAPKLFH